MISGYIIACLGRLAAGKYDATTIHGHLSGWEYQDLLANGRKQSGAILTMLLLAVSAHGAVQHSNIGPVSASDLPGGILRVLFHKPGDEALAISRTEREMLSLFSQEYGLTLQWVPVDASWKLVPELVAGNGDVIVGQGKALAAGMPDQVRFTLPWTTSRQRIVIRSDTGQITRLEDLAFRQVAIKHSSPAWGLLEEIARKHKTMDLVQLPESMEQAEILRRVATGMYDITVVDSEYLKDYLPRHPELSASYDITEGEARAWGVNYESEALLGELNSFINRNHLSLSVSDIYLDDLPRLQERRTLRVITYQDPANYYFDQGRFHGFEYDLIQHFAKSHGMRVDVVLASSHQDMQRLLLNGKGDIIAASLPLRSITNSRIKQSQPYDYAAPVIVGRKSDRPILDIRDLAGRQLVLPATSPYRQHLERIREIGIDFEIIEAEPEVDVEAALSMVSYGMYDLIVLNNYQYKSGLANDKDVVAHFTLSEPMPHVWAIRAADTQLRTAVDEFINNTYRKKFYNVLYAKYFESRDNTIARSGIMPQIDQLSPYDEIVQKYAEKYDFDWRLIVAQMYQESHFNPRAVSYAGAEGLMQLLPTTAELLGAKNITDPKNNIHAGVKYLNMLRDRFEKDLLLEDRVWFSLASYNAGYGRVMRARQLAEDMGLKSDRWFGNVEIAMLALAKPFEKNGEMIRNCRCGQAVVYVREIRTLFNNYVRLTQTTQVARNETKNTPPYDI